MQQLSPEWFEARKNRVTGSIAGAILGVAPYMTRADAMRLMVRESLGAEREFKGNIATEYGKNNEAGALIDYRLETQRTVEPAPFVPFEDWLGASPDGYIGNDGLVEIKCPFSLRKDEKPIFKTLNEQRHYYAQCQIQLYVTGRTWLSFFQWTPHATWLERVTPDQEWLDKALPRLRQFHAEYLDELKNNPDDHLAPKRVEIDTPRSHQLLVEYDDLTEKLQRLTERKKALLDDMVEIAEGKNATINGRKLTSVERKGSVAYAKVVKEKLPDLDLEPYRGKPARYWQVK